MFSFNITDRVEMYDAYLGFDPVGGKPGRSSPNKVPVAAAVQTGLNSKPHLMA